MSVWRSPSTGCQSPRAWPGAPFQAGFVVRLAPILAACVLLGPTLFVSPGSSAAPPPEAAVQPTPRLEVLVVADGWVLRRADPLGPAWGPPLSEDASRRLGPGRAYVPRAGAASERVLLATARDLLDGAPGVVQLRGGDRVPWRDLVRSAEVLGPVRVAPGEPPLSGVLVDARPGSTTR